MPFSSLRRRSTTVAASTNQPQEEQPTPSASVRGRSITLPSISPRKSFSSLLGSAKRVRSTTASPAKSELDDPVQDLFPDYGATKADDGPPQSSRTPSVDKPRRFRRAPSPHPLKGSMASMTQRLSKMNRGTLNKTRSQPSLTQSSPSKSILETLADAIKAPASLFYRENKQSPGSGQGKAEPDDSKTTQGHSTSPKKSVRFRPGKSFIEPEPSSPIDIPKPSPFLPPVQLATTPLQQCLKQVQSDPVPTARPPEPQILKSPTTFRQAIAATDLAVILKGIQESEGVRNPQSSFPASLPGMSDRSDNPFEDPANVTDIEAKDDMLCKYGGRVHNTTQQCQHGPEPTSDHRVNPSEASCHNVVNSETTSALEWIRAHEAIEHPATTAAYQCESTSTSTRSGDMPSDSHTGYAQEKQSPSPIPLPSPSHRPVISLRHSPRTDEPLPGHSDTNMAKPQGMLSVPCGISTEQSLKPPHESVRNCSGLSTTHTSLQSGEAAPFQSSKPSVNEIEELVTEGGHQCGCIGVHGPENDVRYVEGEAQEKRIHGQKEHITVPWVPENPTTPSKLSPSLQSVTARYAVDTWSAELALRSSKSCTNPFGMEPWSPPETHRADGEYDEETTGSRTLRSGKVYDTTKACLSRAPKPSTTSGSPISGCSIKEYVQRTPSPSSIPLPLSIQPGTRKLQTPYSDQHGWSPFEEHEFTFAALAFIGSSEDNFRQLICQPSGFWQFWNWCDLPQETAPCKSTKGLAEWEIDGLLNALNEQNHVPRLIHGQMVEAFKTRIRLAFVRKHRPLGEIESLFVPRSRHDLDETEQTLDSLLVEEAKSLSSHEEYPFCIRGDGLSQPTYDVDSVLGSQDVDRLLDSSTDSVLTKEENLTYPNRIWRNLKTGKKVQDFRDVREQFQETVMAFPDDDAPNSTSSQAGSSPGLDALVSSADHEAADEVSVRTRVTTIESVWSSAGKPSQEDKSGETMPTSCSTTSSQATEEDEENFRQIV